MFTPLTRMELSYAIPPLIWTWPATGVALSLTPPASAAIAVGVRPVGRVLIVSAVKLAPTVVLSSAEAASPVTRIVSSVAAICIIASARVWTPRPSETTRSTAVIPSSVKTTR